ncbi:MAG: MFS transporter [Coleofasciculus sp. B1-GNL1-01]|uniref:MFS transporter n=1 Tax=Coleofasciculus sp. B1-GNL1-01 TaxID=3068484 RepID=UPI0032FE463A
MVKISLLSSTPLWFFHLVPYKIGECFFINLLPLFIVQVVGGSITDVGKTNSLVSLAGVVAFILWGNLSDRLGCRRPFLILGYVGFALCMWRIGVADNLVQVQQFSIAAGFVMAAIIPVSTALVLDTIPEKQWSQSFGRFYLIGGWSFVLALIGGGIWQELVSDSWGTVSAMRSLFVFASGATFLSLILCLIWVQEPQQVRSNRLFSPSLLGRLSVGVIERRVLFYPSRMIYFILAPKWLNQVHQKLYSPLNLYYLCSALFFLAVQIVYLPFPIFLAEVLGATNSLIFLIIFGKALIEAFLYFPIGRFVQNHDSIRWQTLGTAVRVAVFIVFTLLAFLKPTPASLVMIGFAHLFTGLTWAVINVASTLSVASLATKGEEGMALGVYNSIIGVATMVGSLVSGYLAARFGYSVCFATGTVLTGLTVVCFWLLELIIHSHHRKVLSFR